MGWIMSFKFKLPKLTDDKQPDYHIFFVSSILITIGIIASYSLSVYTVEHLEYNQFHFITRQLFAGVLSILIMWGFSQLRPEVLIPLIGWVLFGIFLLLIVTMPLMPSSMVTQSGGATRWIRLGFISISPVEFFKIGFIYYLAHSFNRRLINISKLPFKQEVIELIPYGVIFAILVFFIAYLQKDLGQTVVIGTIIFMMLIFANRSWKIFISIMFIGAAAGIGLITYFPHRINRIQSWWGMVQDSVLPHLPEYLATKLKLDTYTEAYQVGHAINAIHNGSFWGEGIANGYLKLGFLGEVHTDFVLAGIAEEIGLFGLSIIIGLFTYLIIRIFRVSRLLYNKEFHLFSIGIAIMIGTTLIINAFGTSGIIPIKGLAVPFLSYGGSSLLAMGIAIGLVLSISRNNQDYEKQRYAK